MRTLSVIRTAYRATLEEQDDTIVWLVHAMTGNGAELDVLLQGNAVNYVVQGQDASGLDIGGRRQKNAPQLAEDVAHLIARGVTVYVLEEDLVERGLDRADTIAGFVPVARADLPQLFDGYERIWRW